MWTCGNWGWGLSTLHAAFGFVMGVLYLTMQATNKMQQIPFIDIFISALHVSGDKLAHPQEHF